MKATRKSVEGDSKKLVVEARRIRVSADAVADALDLAVNEDDVSDHLVRCTAAVVVDSVCCYRLFGHLLPAADRLVGVAKVPADVTRW